MRILYWAKRGGGTNENIVLGKEEGETNENIVLGKEGWGTNENIVLAKRGGGTPVFFIMKSPIHVLCVNIIRQSCACTKKVNYWVVKNTSC